MLPCIETAYGRSIDHMNDDNKQQQQQQRDKKKQCTRNAEISLWSLYSVIVFCAHKCFTFFYIRKDCDHMWPLCAVQSHY